MSISSALRLARALAAERAGPGVQVYVIENDPEGVLLDGVGCIGDEIFRIQEDETTEGFVARLKEIAVAKGEGFVFVGQGQSVSLDHYLLEDPVSGTFEIGAPYPDPP
jgi:hypothetical protein